MCAYEFPVAVGRLSLSVRLQAFLVSLYLLTVLGLLLWRKAIPSETLVLLLRSCLRRPLRQELTQIQAETGFCYVTTIEAAALSDREGNSSLVLLENGQPLPLPHCGHGEIRSLG